MSKKIINMTIPKVESSMTKEYITRVFEKNYDLGKIINFREIIYHTDKTKKSIQIDLLYNKNDKTENIIKRFKNGYDIKILYEGIGGHYWEVVETKYNYSRK